ncbi:MAG TPA: alpha-2-macroglobulin family protein [Candidatus Sulfomarinibacteraceae bacterium]|nr:alpha-2-macroglobulin family protein [Candidatus Sulfomarinibacteraceae bacterium]
MDREEKTPFSRRTRIVGLLVALLLVALPLVYLAGRSLLGDNGQNGTVDQTPGAPATPGIQLQIAGSEAAALEAGGAAAQDAQLQIRLSAGQEPPESAETLPVTTGDPLDDDEIAAILARLPELTPEADDEAEFRLPEESLPPPRTGDTLDEPFPPPDEAAPPAVTPEPADGPLEVLRFAPEGDIPLAPFLQVTFNQPMVPLATLEQLQAEDVPVELTPQIPGVWRWIGTKTLTFEYEGEAGDRFPMATEYVAQIPAGTTSAAGGVLQETVTWQFSTPRPQLVTHYPRNGPQPLEPLIFLGFDQQITPQAVLDTVRVTAGGRDVSLRLATTEEIEADEQVNRLVTNHAEGRWLVFRPQEPLPEDTAINVVIGPGTPSAEGPLTTTEAQSFDFRTYAALQVDDHRCGWSERDCRPFEPFFIRMNNPLALDAFTEEMLRIEPALPGATVNVFGDTIEIRGATQGRTTYEVTLSAEVSDIFGQTLGRDETLTFRVGPAEPVLFGPNDALVTLDPASDEPTFSVYTINFNRLEVEAYAVTPEDWPAYLEYRRNYARDRESPPSPPGRQVLDETIRVEAAEDALTEVGIELGEALEGEHGHLVVIVQPPSGLLSGLLNRSRPVVQAWVQVTDIGLDAFADHSELVAWATNLQDGAPLSGVTLSLPPSNVEGVTGSDGTARLQLPGTSGIALVARAENGDAALLPRYSHFWDDSGWEQRSPQDDVRWFVFDDRQMYRPGEEVHLKGWLRRVGATQTGDVRLPDGVSSLSFEVYGPQGNELTGGSADVSTLGGFDLAFTIPENSNLGHAHVRLRAAGGEYHHTFQIQEFRRPEFEVTARNESEGPFFVGDEATVSVSANYFAGGPLPNADVTWNVTTSSAQYEPPNWPDFVFGEWTPWWHFPIYEDAFYRGMPGPGFPVQESETFTGTTDAAGKHFLQIDFEALDKPQPVTVMAEATVMDVNRQAWAGSTSLLVHPADLYVGLRSERTFVQRGEPLEIEAVVVDIDGNLVSGHPLTIEAARLEWGYHQGRWGEEVAETQTCNVQPATNDEQPVTCTFDTENGGSYRITATVEDEQGRANQSRFTRWVSGGQRPPARQVEQEQVTLIPDKETYQPGDVAQVLVQSPFSPAEGLLTVSRSGILYTERFQMSEGSYTLQIPVEEAHLPNLHLQVDLAGEAPRLDDAGDPLPDAPPRPAFASGSLNLEISKRSRTLDVSAAPQASELEPGGETTVDVTVTGPDGQPVAGAEVALVVVDEAILALTNYQLADPLNAFYQDRPSFVESTYGRESILLARPESLLEQGAQAVEATRVTTEVVAEEGEMAMDDAMPMEAPAAEPAADADGAQAGQEASPIRQRTDFNPLAAFVPAVTTDEQGRAAVPVQLPDNLTRYRIMAVAAAGENQFGSGESSLTARLPLMVRPSAPRFLNFGDTFELPVVLQNQTEEEMTVDVVVQATNLSLTAGAGQRVTVPANDRVEVRFPAAAESAGTARLQIAAVSGDYADAATAELPVYTPATTEAFATYGVIDEGAIAQPLLAPANVWPQFGGLEISTSSTALQALTDAVLYLVSYPYDSSPQLASRILAVAALRDVLTAFEAEELPPPEEIEAAVQRDIEQLQGLQNNDGGFPSWRRGDDSIPFFSIHVAHALYRAQTMGFEVPQEMMSRSLDHLRNIESYYPSWYGQRTRQSLSSYALYVRHLMGDTDRAKAANLLDEAGLEELSLEAVAWLWQVLGDDPAYAEQSDAIHRHLQNRAVETANAANFTTSYGDDAYLMLHSNRRTDGIILDALIANRPDSDLIPKVVNGLLAHRTRGRWDNTQENVFILLALDRYFDTFEAETPDFVARIWLGDDYAGSHEFEGRTTDIRQTNVPMSYLLDGDEERDLILSKEGPGRLYYRLGLRYAPDDLVLDPLDMGFVVERIYEAVDDPDDVIRDDDGRWRIRAGARVRVKLTMVASNRRYHVALVDPLPAGLEIVNPALAVSGDVPDDPDEDVRPYGWWWWGTWYEHQNMRDERAEAFTTLLWDGVYTYSYVARATTPGVFVAPPAKAEEMYSPEVFGRSSTDWVIVE